MKVLSVLPVFALSIGLAQAQPPTKIEFEVASIRPFTQDSSSGQATVGLHVDGAQVRAVGRTLAEFIGMAYNVKAKDVAGLDWIASERFDISAKLPEGSKQDQIPDMMKTLLDERFSLKFHKESKDFPVYFLEAAKGGAKLTESPIAPDSDDPEEAKKGLTVGGTGGTNGVAIDLGHGAFYSLVDNRFSAKKVNMDQAASSLQGFLDRRVVNKTGLARTYDISLDLSEDDYRVMLIRAGLNSGFQIPPQALRVLDLPSGDSLAIALEKLGLKLSPGKAPFDVYVVDQANKTPSAN